MRIDLSEEEFSKCIAEGNRRHKRAMKRNYKTSPDNKDSNAGHIRGCCGELAASKWLGAPWPPSINSFGGPDIPPDIQVRMNKWHFGDLMVRKKDKPNEKFLLVVSADSRNWKTLHIIGWLWGHEAQKDEYWKLIHRKAIEHQFWVPQNKLRSKESLKHAYDSWVESQLKVLS